MTRAVAGDQVSLVGGHDWAATAPAGCELRAGKQSTLVLETYVLKARRLVRRSQRTLTCAALHQRVAVLKHTGVIGLWAAQH